MLGGRKLEFHRVLALRTAAASVNRGDDCNLSIAISAAEAAVGSRWSLPFTGISEQRTSINTTSSKDEDDKTEANAQRSTLNAQCSIQKGF
jgi:hypothetical protein